MREFFHGWRRKAGCVTLVMACAIAGLGMRSRISYDIASFAFNSRQHQIVSIDSRLEWRAFNLEPSSVGFNRWTSVDAGDLVAYLVRYDFWQFEHSQRHAEKWASPDWVLVVPFTVLSAYLLLWKPRQRTEPDHA